MKQQCRAKDPSSCRKHGTSTSQTVNSAVMTGDAGAYLSARAEMEKKESPAYMVPQMKEVPEKAVEAAAKAKWEKDGNFKWKSTSPEERQDCLEQERIALESAVAHMPNGVITEEAVESMAISHRATSRRDDWDSLHPVSKDQYRVNARHALEAAAPHMGIAGDDKGAIRNMFRRIFAG